MELWREYILDVAPPRIKPRILRVLNHCKIKSKRQLCETSPKKIARMKGIGVNTLDFLSYVIAAFTPRNKPLPPEWDEVFAKALVRGIEEYICPVEDMEEKDMNQGGRTR